MASYDEDLKNHQQDLIRKALKGSFFVGLNDAPALTTLTQYTPAAVGPPAVPESIDLVPLPDPWDDAGLLSSDGVGAASEQSTSDVTSWGYTSPTRSDVTTDTTTLTVVMQETKLLTLQLYTGNDLSAVVPAPGTGEINIDKAQRPRSVYVRGLLLAVDESDEGEIFIGRYFPKIKVGDKADQAFGGGDEPIGYGVTFTTFVDDTVGFSERWLFGGIGWRNKLVKMGFPAAAAGA